MPKDAAAKDAPELAAFDWSDPLLLEDQLTEEERMIRDAARAYAQEKLQPRVTRAYAEEQTDPAIFAEMGRWVFWVSPSPRNSAAWVRVMSATA